MPDQFLRVRDMSGSAVNGNGGAAIIIGTKAPGNIHGRAIPGNRDIGKMEKRVTNGKKAGGNNNN